MLNVFCCTWLTCRRQALERSHIKKEFIDKPATQTCTRFTSFIGTPNNLHNENKIWSHYIALKYMTIYSKYRHTREHLNRKGKFIAQCNSYTLLLSLEKDKNHTIINLRFLFERYTHAEGNFDTGDNSRFIFYLFIAKNR